MIDFLCQIEISLLNMLKLLKNYFTFPGKEVTLYIKEKTKKLTTTYSLKSSLLYT